MIKASQERLAGIESFRVLAVLCVICIHTEPFKPYAAANPVFRIFYLLAMAFYHFAVPFFFTASGYFFTRSLQKGKEALPLFFQYAKRLLLIFSAWSLIYAFMPEDFLFTTLKSGFRAGFWEPALSRFALTVSRYREHPVFYFFEGSKPHLWYLLSLVVGLGILTCGIFRRKEKVLLAVAVILYALGLCIAAYRYTAAGIELPFRFDGKEGPFGAALFLVLGWLIAKKNFRLSISAALVLAVLGYAVCVVENFLLYGPKDLKSADFLLGTIPFGAGMFLLALALPDFGSKSRIAALGVWTLGVYVTHMLVWEMIWGFSRFFPPPVWQAVFPFLIFGTALGLSFLLKKNPFTRTLVS